jgi:simple sugar transport system substrate-binding protein
MRFAALVVLVALLAGCGGTTVVTEPTLVVTPGQSPDAAPQTPAGPSGGVRIAVVTHGQASSSFWAIVRNGVEAAARQMDVVVSYRAPDVYSLERMKAMIDQAVATRPDGLVVSIPEPGLAPAIRRAVRAGIPVVSINSGSNVYRRLGVLAHVGQPEERAGFEAGRRLAAAGAHRVLCVNQQIGNQGLDARCRGLARAMRRAGGRSRVLGVDDQSPATPRKIADAVRRGGNDGVLALNSLSGVEAVKGVRQIGRAGAVKVATFDLGPDVLRAVRAHQLLFAVDQQAYLQGYLPIVLLTQRARYGLFPAQGDVLPTGPNFVTAATAGKAIELSKRSIR